MTTNMEKYRNPILAGIAFLSLAIFILACTTSFSPDDSKVLYPSPDPQSGNLGVAVYDRNSKTSEQLLTMAFLKNGLRNSGPMLRPQWLPDGKGVVVVSSAADNADEGLIVSLIPQGGKGPIKQYFLTDIDATESVLMLPLTLVGHRLFMVNKSGAIHRLDLDSGQTQIREMTNSNPYLQSPPGSDQVYYFNELKDTDGVIEVGRLILDTLEMQKTYQIKRIQGVKLELPTLSPDGKRSTWIAEKDGEKHVFVYRGAELEKTLLLVGKEEMLDLGVTQFSSKGESLFTSYQSSKNGQRGVDCGLMEIPLASGKPRRLALVTGKKRDVSATMYFQPGLSHDGKTVAVCTTYLGLFEKDYIDPADMALFLIDISNPEWKVTKVAVPKVNPALGKQ